MADFLTAYKLTAINEGGYGNTCGDSGGETYAGISRNNFPMWQGWSIVDSFKKRPNFPANMKDSIPLPLMVKSFYRLNFWTPMRGDEINDQGVASNIYDMAVNSGVGTAIKLAQQTAGLPATGQMDNDTLNHLNNKA